VKVQVSYPWIVQHGGNRLGQIHSIDHICRNHVVVTVKCPDRNEPGFQHFGHFSNAGKGLFSLFPDKYGVRGPVGCLTGLVLKIDLYDGFANLSVCQADAAGVTGFGVGHHPGCAPLRKLSV
jgi:hypothetical protein